MATFKRFEDILAWQKANELNEYICGLVSEGRLTSAPLLRDQLVEASDSIMSNIAEGFNRGGNKEFKQFLGYARGSAGEVRSRSRSALNGKHFTAEQFGVIEGKTVECEKLIGGLIKYLKECDLKGWTLKE